MGNRFTTRLEPIMRSEKPCISTENMRALYLSNLAVGNGGVSSIILFSPNSSTKDSGWLSRSRLSS
jgi:hypothetical protein